MVNTARDKPETASLAI